MAMTNQNSQTTLTHPETGRTMQIDSLVYKHFKAAILKSLKKKQGIAFTELVDAVKKIIRKEFASFKGSVSWYTISVLHNLQSEGLAGFYHEKGKKLNHLL